MTACAVIVARHPHAGAPTLTSGRCAIALLCALLAVTSQVRAADHYGAADFARTPKFDAHVHANTDDREFLDIAAKDGFELLSINVDYPDFPSMDRQAGIAHRLAATDPRRFHFITTFSMKGFGQPNWSADTIQHIDAEMQRGALGVKVWKNVGMIERNSAGTLIMLDDPGFDALARHLEERHIPLIAHQAGGIL